ncbi:MAG: FAD-binding oxidoreductase [Planctomycetota bacterium]|nr:MAG: FAD-binding oxidoreductase [Planctomycetota bacterium]
MSAPPLESADLARALTCHVEGEVRLGRHDRMLYATDASIYQVEPLAVVIPASTDDAVRAVRFCARHGLPILPRGGGTSLAGQCTNRAVVIDFSACCTALLQLDVPGHRCRVEAGLTIDDLNDLLRPSGLFFAPDPATARQANVGGCIGNNAAGARSILYGRTSENLLGVDVCTADGQTLRLDEGAATRDERVHALTRRVVEVVRRSERLIRERFPKTLRRNAGYALDLILDQLEQDPGDLSRINLAKLLCGSEGTLAVTLGAELLLRSIPLARGLAIVSFESLDAAIDAVVPILKLNPSAVELLDDMVISLASAQSEYRHYVTLLPHIEGHPPPAVLYVEFSAEHSCDELADRFDALRTTVGRASVSCLTEPNAQLRAWKLRKAGEPLLHGIPGRRKPISFVEDNAVPPERLAEFVRRFRAIVDAHGTRAAYWAHASVGVLHIRPLLDIADEADRVHMQQIAIEAADLARELGGVMSGEHGDGRVRGPLLERFFGPELMQAFREIKAIFDPRNLLNPGNIVEPGPPASIATRLRVCPEGRPVRVPSLDTFFRYDDQHGFDAAVETCNGAGVCRKKSGGVMCPSYQATLDERHSTRGRGNALRLAITGQFDRGTPAWDDQETLATLDLCLSCKACKSECPSNVDIARLKAEFLAQHDRASNGPSLRRRVFGNIHTLNRLAAMAPHLANTMSNSALGKLALSRALGVDPRRSLPLFTRPLHKCWRKTAADCDSTRPLVTLLADTFTSHNEPQIALDARRVLEAFGYRVSLYLGSDFGRASISQGLLPEAIADAERHVDRLSTLLENAPPRALLTLEPSCHSAIVDDWPALRLNRPRPLVQKIAEHTHDICAFLEANWNSHPIRPELKPLHRDIALHAHCHQKALDGTAATLALLSRLTSGSAFELDTGCCGMAGAFGFTRDHFELSRRIAELSLLPQVDRLPPEAVLVAPGTSCRHQLTDFSTRRAVHPASLLGSLV